MKGMTPEQYAQILQKCFKEHSFYGHSTPKSKGFKYIDATFDSRDGQIWLVKMRGGFMNDMIFSANHFVFDNLMKKPRPNGMEWENLYDWIIDFLDDKWVPTKGYFKQIKS